MKLRARFALAALVLAESALLAALALQQVFEKRHLERKQVVSQESALRRLARVAQDASLELNEVFLVNYLRVLKDTPEVRYAALVDEQGLVRVHTAMFEGAPVIGTPWEGPRNPGQPSLVVRGGGVEDWSAPVLKAGRPVGEVHLGFDEGRLRASVAADLADSRRPLLWAALGLSLLAVLAAARLARGLTAPLALLFEGTRRLGAGELGHRVDEGRRDELGDLARGFNQMAEEIERSSRFREQLMGSITHDLRSPLMAIQNHAELLLDAGATAEERRESSELIHENARRMAAMADDITDLVKIQMGRLPLDRKRLDLAGSMRAVAKLLDVVARRLEVSLELELGEAPLFVEADSLHVQRVLTNLVSNALKFTPSGGRILMRAAGAAHHVKISIEDTGTGIPAQKLPLLFSRFTGSEGVKHGGSGLGTGLGLSICRELVERHGGRIWAESEWKKGTRIHFTLPLGSSPCSDGC